MTAHALPGVGRDDLVGDGAPPLAGMTLASMEGADEAARHAVNALLDADGSTAERCTTWGHYRPPELEPLKRIDEVRFGLGLPNTFDLG